MWKLAQAIELLWYRGYRIKKRSNVNSKNTGISEESSEGYGHEQSQICNLRLYLIIVQLSVFMAIIAAEFVWILLNLFLKKKKLSENEQWFWKKIQYFLVLYWDIL